MPAAAKPTRKQPSIAETTCATSAITSVPSAMPPSPRYTSVDSRVRFASTFSRFTPSSRPMPIIALATPKVRVEACRVSRTYTAISGPKHPITNMPAPSATITNSNAAWCTIKLVPARISVNTFLRPADCAPSVSVAGGFSALFFKAIDPINDALSAKLTASNR